MAGDMVANAAILSAQTEEKVTGQSERAGGSLCQYPDQSLLSPVFSLYHLSSLSLALSSLVIMRK